MKSILHITKLSLLHNAALAVAILGVATPAVATETKSEKVQTKVEEIQKDMKKGGRKAKKIIRDETGNESITEDLKDSARNVGDDIEHNAKKIKRKVD